MEVCVKSSGVVVGCNSFSAGVAQVTVHGFMDAEFRMKVIKYVKMKLPKVTLMELLSSHAVQRRLRRDELPSCRSPRKAEWRHHQLMGRCTHRFSFCLGVITIIWLN
jgi:hypothetical protein